MSEVADSLDTRSKARKIVIDLTIMTAIGVVLAFIGPFGSFSEPLAYRLVSWVTFAWIGYAIYSSINGVADRLADALAMPRIFAWAVTVIVATVPMTAIVWSMRYVPGPVPLPSLEAALTTYFYVLVVGGGITAFFYMIEDRRSHASSEHSSAKAKVESEADAAASSASEETKPANPLLDQLPAALGSAVIALEMEDHYVRVHTPLGSHLVLMRLRDAMGHVAEIDGRQVHRSWWVAKGAVEDVKRDGRNVRLVLGEQLEAPISRAQVSELKAAGWI
ncbi:MAG: LytTR family DNA-binding domain-containing protein [Pseudomonadota bacterium]